MLQCCAIALEPSFDRHAARVQGAIPTNSHPERHHRSHFILNGAFAKKPPCSDTSRTWILTPDTGFLAESLEAPAGVIVNEKSLPMRVIVNESHCPCSSTVLPKERDRGFHVRSRRPTSNTAITITLLSRTPYDSLGSFWSTRR